jgi:hypothetical protein
MNEKQLADALRATRDDYETRAEEFDDRTCNRD